MRNPDNEKQRVMLDETQLNEIMINSVMKDSIDDEKFVSLSIEDTLRNFSIHEDDHTAREIVESGIRKYQETIQNKMLEKLIENTEFDQFIGFDLMSDYELCSYRRAMLRKHNSVNRPSDKKTIRLIEDRIYSAEIEILKRFERYAIERYTTQNKITVHPDRDSNTKTNDRNDEIPY